MVNSLCCSQGLRYDYMMQELTVNELNLKSSLFPSRENKRQEIKGQVKGYACKEETLEGMRKGYL